MSVENVASKSPSVSLHVEESSIRESIKKRGTIKGKLTLFAKFVNSFCNVQLLDDKQLTELKLRSDIAQSLLSDFDNIQTSIEMMMVSESDLTYQLEARETFENIYYETMADVGHEEICLRGDLSRPAGMLTRHLA
ncbi:hypothetical protein ACJJTC_017312 [Scirpophaga incertulas]